MTKWFFFHVIGSRPRNESEASSIFDDQHAKWIRKPELIFLNTMRMMTATDKYHAYASLTRSKQAA